MVHESDIMNLLHGAAKIGLESPSSPSPSLSPFISSTSGARCSCFYYKVMLEVMKPHLTAPQADASNRGLRPAGATSGLSPQIEPVKYFRRCAPGSGDTRMNPIFVGKLRVYMWNFQNVVMKQISSAISASMIQAV
jgi:hypothetical protein